MSSWRLLQRVLVFWDAAENPIFIRTTAYPPVWKGLAAWAARSTGLIVMLGGLGCYLSTLLVFYVNNPLILLIPLLALWTLLLGLTLGPIVVQERQALTWEILLATPLDMETILLGKAGGALWWLRDLIRVIAGVVMLFALGIGLLSLVLAPLLFEDSNVSGQILCALSVLMPLISALLFIADRAQHFVLMTVAALLASTVTSTVRAALKGGIVAGLCAWMFDVGLGIGAIVLLRGAGHFNLLALATLGPTATFLMEFALGPLVAAVAAALLVREIAVRLLWQITLRTAREP